MRLAFTKFLRVNLLSEEKEDVFRDMILETKIVEFILKNLESKQLLFESTFFLANATQFNDSEVCEKLVNRFLVPTSNLIDIKEFKKYIKDYENQKVVENIIWFWSNILAEDSYQKTTFFH